MHDRTKATLDQLGQAEWFRAVGQQDTDAARVLTSWEEAVQSCASLAWENLLLEALNQYRERLLSRSKERFRQWNRIVEELKPITMPLVVGKIARVVREHDLPQVFADTVQWDILGVTMEAEYADVYPPGFYASQAYWYVQGHFPCGWEGDFPEGRLIIY
jgi:hypothetical protein